MISHIDIKNYRCLRDVSVPLKPLTVLVGPNDSGKSTFLSAVQLLIQGAGPSQEDAWRGQLSTPITIRAATNGNGLYLERDFASGNHRRTSDPVLNDFGGVARFQLPSDGVAMSCDGVPDTASTPELGPDGGKLAALLDHILRTDRRRFDQIEVFLSELIPGFGSLDIRTPSASTRRVDLVIEKGFHLPGQRASAGLRLLLFFVTLASHPSPPTVILIEEPEAGVHPRRLFDVIGLLRGISRGLQSARASQIIITTHSPYLLDLINPVEEQVLVFRRQDDGSRTAKAVDADGLAEFLDEFKLGEVWYNEGEERLIGKPSA